MSWQSKYTMPTESLESFVTNSKKNSIVIVVPEQQVEKFLEETKNYKWQLIKTTDKFRYYYSG